jgi:hypothetical protein
MKLTIDHFPVLRLLILFQGMVLGRRENFTLLAVTSLSRRRYNTATATVLKLAFPRKDI